MQVFIFLKLVRLAPLKKEWVACGMNDYRDKNGKDPLSDKLSRVYVFKVENINPPEVVVPPNTTAQKLKSKKGGSKNG